MSMWTHITACMSVDTYIEEKKPLLLKLIKNWLKEAPKITGSERNADIYVNIQSGHNAWTNADCFHCEYKHTQKKLGKGEFECFPPEGYTCKEASYQTCIVISIQGDLRDRTKEQTEKEFNAFKKYVEDSMCIRDYAVNIEGE